MNVNIEGHPILSKFLTVIGTAIWWALYVIAVLVLVVLMTLWPAATTVGIVAFMVGNLHGRFTCVPENRWLSEINWEWNLKK